MRIIAGQWRGVPIAAPKGDTTRPTVDRVRESLMSSLNSALCGFEGVVALDAFAGSGACGLELLSRGAESVWFYEMNANAYACIQANIAKLHVDERCYELRKQDVLQQIIKLICDTCTPDKEETDGVRLNRRETAKYLQDYTMEETFKNDDKSLGERTYSTNVDLMNRRLLRDWERATRSKTNDYFNSLHV